MRSGQLSNLSTGRLVAYRLECADTSLTRVAGLLGRASLAHGEGLWIKPSSGIHTVGMRFPIDVVGLDAGLRIVRLWPKVRPNRVPWPSARVRSVVELAAGEIAAHRLHLGHALAFFASPEHRDRALPLSPKIQPPDAASPKTHPRARKT